MRSGQANCFPEEGSKWEQEVGFRDHRREVISEALKVDKNKELSRG